MSSSPPRRSSPRRPSPSNNPKPAADIGKRTGVTLPPKGSIPLNSDGYEDLDAFWEAAKSPALNNSTDASSGSKKQAASQEQLQTQQQQEEENIQNPPSLRHNSELKHKYGIQTPKNVSGWSNRLLHKAMGIPTAENDGDSPSVLSRVSTAPRSVRTVNSAAGSANSAAGGGSGGGVGGGEGNDDVEVTVGNRKDPEEYNGQSSIANNTEEGPMDPPEEEVQRGLDPEEEEAVFDGFDNDAGSSPQQSQSQKSSTGKTPDMENSMEEMVNRYDDEYDKEEGRGFELNTQDNEEVGFENSYGGFNEEENDEEQEEQVASQKSGKSQSDDEEEELALVAKKPRGHPKKDNVSTPTSVLRTKKSKRKKDQASKSVNWSTPNGTTGYPVGNRDYELHPVSEYKQHYEPGEEPQTPGGTELRRSHRFRVKPLQFWKNEKFVYAAQNEPGALGEAMGDMPVVKDVQRALPTPHKERPKKPEAKKSKKEDKESKKKRRRGDDSDDDEDGGPRARIPFDPTQLMKRHKYSNGEHGTVWSEALEDTTELKLVSRLDNRSFSKLPLSANRGKKESKVVGFASQAFHVPTDQDDLFPGYIAGNVVLPPRGIKDAEGVGLCSQVFNVGDCQPGSVEFALADPADQDGEFDPKTAQRFLLSKGDMFQIPPGNVYRIENHSKTDEARLFWTIIKCTSRAEQVASDEE